jgi:arylsulfatase A-like enzyme
MRAVLALLAAFATAPAALAQDNVLILLADDIGIDQLASYGLGADLPATPNLDALAAGGVLFRNAYSSPVCSPTRAQILTGRHPFRTGIGHIVGPTMVSPELFQLPLDELTLPEMLDQGTGNLYAHAAIGKWHLYDGLGFESAPNAAGFAHFAGTPANLGFDSTGYYNWIKVVDGTFFVVLDDYATTDQVDEALAFLQTAPEPWFCYVAFSSAHFPYHAPPAALHTQDLSGAGDPATNPRPYYKAMVEALDTEIGRLLVGIAPALPRTNIFFACDNGTPFEVTVPPFDPDHAKATLYEGGCHVPLIASGPAVDVPGSECEALVVLTDLFATAAEIASVDLAAVEPAGTLLDSVSLMPYLHAPSTKSLRDTAFAQTFAPLGSAPYNLEGVMLRDARYKLIRVFTEGVVGFPAELYDLELDPFEQTNLLVAPLAPAVLDAYRRLDRAQRDLLRAAQLSGPAGSEDHVLLGTNTNASGGSSASANFRVTAQTGLAAHGAANSSTRRTLPGATWLTGGLASDHPLVFGFGDARGSKAGGEQRALFGFGLDGLAGASVDAELGGVELPALTVLTNTHALATTPAGIGQFGNPAGVETLYLRTDGDHVLETRAFAFLPAIDVLGPTRIGGTFRMRVAAQPGDLFQTLWGKPIPGLALPVPPLGGTLELLAQVNPLTQPAITASGEEVLVAPIPYQAALIGIGLDFQGIAASLDDLSKGGFTNRVHVVVGPPL